MEEENFIQLKKDNILRIGIKDSNGVPTGEHLEFDVEDIELPLRLADAQRLHDKNVDELKRKVYVIEKKQDVKGEILSKNEEEKMRAIKEFYEKEEEALDLFLGENGTKKLLNGRKPYLTMWNDIGEIIEPIMPLLKVNTESIHEKIKEKYSKKEDNVL